jgi:K+-transporting ATPase ATPase C chain
MSLLRPTFVLLAAFSVLTGLVYPALITVGAVALYPDAAHGSLLRVQGESRGSRLIGQPFTSPGYFWGRPSATVHVPYDASASAGSNRGPSSPLLAAEITARVALLRELDPTLDRVPVDLVTSSGSGLDPHVSPDSARVQVARVAKARGISPAEVAQLVQDHIEERTMGVLGEPRVNVLALNLALDTLARP